MLRVGKNSLGYFAQDGNGSRYLCEDGIIRDWAYIRHSHHTVYFPTEAHAMLVVSDYEAKKNTLAMIAQEVLDVPKEVGVPNIIVVVYNPSMRLAIPKFKEVIMFIMS